MIFTANPHYRRSFLRAAGVLMIAAAAVALAAPGGVQADSPAAATKLKLKPKPPQPGKEVFIRTKPHVNVGPARPAGPTSLKGQVPVLYDWYCGEGSGPGGYAACTQDLIDSCSGTYVPPKTNGEHQTWGMCHESSGG